MPAFCYFIIDLVKVFVFALNIAMLIRAVLSWIPGVEGNVFAGFIYTVTEPLIVPVRMLFSRFGWFERSPLDIAFFATGLILTLLLYILISI